VRILTKQSPTIRERLATVEAELKYLREEVEEVGQKLSDFKGDVYHRFELLNNHLSEIREELSGLRQKFDSHGSLGGKEKASIIVALISSISAIIVTILRH